MSQDRHTARAIALQVLFMWDFNDQDTENIDFYIDYNLKEFIGERADRSFVFQLVHNTIQNKKESDTFINLYAKEWPVERLTIMDRTILRIAIYEMLNSQKTNVPPKVALNEAVELAKEYSGDSSQKFVSGILGAIYENYFKPQQKQNTLFKTK